MLNSQFIKNIIYGCTKTHSGQEITINRRAAAETSLRGPVLAQNTTNTSLRNLCLAANEVDAGTPTRGAQKFPRAASDRISLSSVRSDTLYDPMHFLPLLEQKVGALDQAAPLQGWDLPEAFATLHRLLEARMGKLDLSRICTAPLTWYFATKETVHGITSRRGVSQGCLARAFSLLPILTKSTGNSGKLAFNI